MHNGVPLAASAIPEIDAPAAGNIDGSQSDMAPFLELRRAYWRALVALRPRLMPRYVGADPAGSIAATSGSSWPRISSPLLMAQITAWVRLCTRILRRISLTCIFTAASASCVLRAMALLESPVIKYRKMDFCRGDNSPA